MIEQKQHSQPGQQVGDSVEHNHAAHERGQNLSTQRHHDAGTNDQTADHTPLETLSFGGGEEHWPPQIGPSDETGPDGRGDARFGVDDVVRD